jgi:hypothetical protein
VIAINRAVVLLTFVFIIGIACSSVCDNYANTEDDAIDDRGVPSNVDIPNAESILESRKREMIGKLCETNTMAKNISSTLKAQED